jgi:hypothetical protein
MTRHFPTYFHILCTYFADYCVMSLAVRTVLAMSSVPKEWGPTKPEMHILRDRRPSTAACPACWARCMGDKGIEILYRTVRKKIFCAGPIRAAKAEQPSPTISFTGTTSPMNQPRKGPFHLYSLSSQSPKFQQSAVATPL